MSEESSGEGRRKPSRAVVESVADREGVDPVHLNPPLDAAIDPEALDALFSPRPDGISRENGTVSFEYHGYEVAVAADGTVDLESPD